jgi:hypothetical protein
MARILFTNDSPGHGPYPVIAHLLGIMQYHNADVRITEVYKHECGIIVEVSDAAEGYLPVDNEQNESYGTFRLPQRSIRHTNVGVGYCPICGHHGSYCKGARS